MGRGREHTSSSRGEERVVSCDGIYFPESKRVTVKVNELKGCQETERNPGLNKNVPLTLNLAVERIALYSLPHLRTFQMQALKANSLR